mmetsp:Transcript_21519/g.85568  ORF Transcript_21519/g.85568 Transcript_21519/m.85568 type:complete len:782 (-) Transcript_21519:50-2395(-)
MTTAVTIILMRHQSSDNRGLARLNTPCTPPPGRGGRRGRRASFFVPRRLLCVRGPLLRYRNVLSLCSPADDADLSHVLVVDGLGPRSPSLSHSPIYVSSRSRTSYRCLMRPRPAALGTSGSAHWHRYVSRARLISQLSRLNQCPKEQVLRDGGRRVAAPCPRSMRDRTHVLRGGVLGRIDPPRARSCSEEAPPGAVSTRARDSSRDLALFVGGRRLARWFSSGDDLLLDGGGCLAGDVDGRAELGADGDGVVDGVVEEVVDERVVERDARVDGREGLLLEEVVEARRPLARAQARRARAVVDHEGDALVVHVRAERVDGLDDRLVDDLRVRVPRLAQDVDLGHHHGDVDARREAVDGRRLGRAIGADLLADRPRVRAVDLADGVRVEAVAVHDDRADLVARGDLVVDLLQNLLGRRVRRLVGDVEVGPLRRVEVLVERLDALLRDRRRDRARDRLARPLEGRLGRRALRDVPSEQRLDDAVDAAEQDAALAVDVRLVLVGERRLEQKRRPQGDAPAERDVGRRAGHVLVDAERRVDAGAVDVLALLVQSPHRRAHAFGTDRDDVDGFRERLADRLEVAEEEAVRQSQRRAGLHRGEDLLVELGLRGVRDEQHHEVRLRDGLEHLAQRAVGFGEANGFGRGPRRRVAPQADLDRDRRAFERFFEVLRLRGGLRPPADDADLPDPLKRRRQLLEEVAPAAHDLLRRPGELDRLLLEHRRLERRARHVSSARRQRGDHRSRRDGPRRDAGQLKGRRRRGEEQRRHDHGASSGHRRPRRRRRPGR